MQNPQQKHYETIHQQYAAHYYDKAALAYREEFIISPLLGNLQLDRWRIADLACGDGHTSLAIKRRFPQASFVGFDISGSAREAYECRVGSPAYRADLSSPSFSEIVESMPPFDAAIVVGGLHHCVNDLDMTLKNIARILRPQGILMMMEPNAEFVLEIVRNAWYRVDKYFDADSERALVHDELARRFAGNFDLDVVRYFGGPAYYLVLNSLLFRIPLGIKPAIAKPLFWSERLFNRLPGRALFPAFVARWQKR